MRGFAAAATFGEVDKVHPGPSAQSGEARKQIVTDGHSLDHHDLGYARAPAAHHPAADASTPSSYAVLTSAGNRGR